MKQLKEDDEKTETLAPIYTDPRLRGRREKGGKQEGESVRERGTQL